MRLKNWLIFYKIGSIYGQETVMGATEDDAGVALLSKLNFRGENVHKLEILEAQETDDDE